MGQNAIVNERGEEEVLGATNWVGAMNRDAEGSYVQLQILYRLCFGPELGAFGAVLWRLRFSPVAAPLTALPIRLGSVLAPMFKDLAASDVMI